MNLSNNDFHLINLSLHKLLQIYIFSRKLCPRVGNISIGKHNDFIGLCSGLGQKQIFNLNLELNNPTDTI